MKNSVVTALFFLFWIGFASSGSTAENTISLDVRHGGELEGCLKELDLKVGVAAKLGYNPFVGEAEERFRIEFRRRKQGTGYVARIFRVGSDEVTRIRSLETTGPDCSVLSKAVVLTVSVAVEPSVRLNSPTPSSANVSEVNRNSEDNPRYRLHHAILAAQLADIERALAASKPKETTEPNSTIGISGSVGPGVSFGTAPSGIFSSVLGGSLHLGEHFSVRVDGRFEPSSEEHRDGVKFNTGLVLGTLGGCVRRTPLFACGLFAGGALRQWGETLDTNRSNESLYLGAGGRLGSEVMILQRMGLRLQGELLGTIVPTSTVAGGREIWRTPSVSGHIAGLIFYKFL